MENTVQLMDQMLLTTMTTSGGAQNARTQTSGKDDFGSMVRQKQQQAKGQDNAQKSQQKQSPQKKGETKAAKDAKPQQAGQEQETATEQVVLAAALLFQMDFQDNSVQFTTDAPEEELAAGGDFVPVLEIDVTGVVEAAAEDTAPEAAVQAEETVEIAPEQFEAVERQAVEHTDAPVQAAEEETTEETVQVEAAVSEAPVFQQVEAAPVKVAEPQTEQPIDLNRPQGVEELANRIQNLMVNTEGESRVEFTLIPASLGKISVEIVRSGDGALHVQLGATTLRAAELLNRHAGGLEQAMAASNRSNVQVEIKASEEAQKQFLNPNAEQQQEQQRRQQEQQRRRNEDEEAHPHEAVDFVQQLRLGLASLNT